MHQTATTGGLYSGRFGGLVVLGGQ